MKVLQMITRGDANKIIIKKAKTFVKKELLSIIDSQLGKDFDNETVKKILDPYQEHIENTLKDTTFVSYLKTWYKSFLLIAVRERQPLVKGKIDKRKTIALFIQLLRFYTDRDITLKDLS